MVMYVILYDIKPVRERNLDPCEWYKLLERKNEPPYEHIILTPLVRVRIKKRWIRQYIGKSLNGQTFIAIPSNTSKI